MKYTVISLLALCSLSQQLLPLEALPGAVFTSEKHTRRHTNFRNLAIIEKLDGAFFTAVEIQDAFKVIHMIFEIQYGKQDPETKKRIGIYLFNDAMVALKELVKEEQTLIRDNVSKTDSRWTELNKVLRTVKDDFNAKIKASERSEKSSNSVAQGIQKKLIEFFLADQKIEDPILRNTDDKAAFDAASATEFFRFLNNLKHFLEDLSNSCTVAHQSYKRLVQKAKESRNS